MDKFQAITHSGVFTKLHMAIAVTAADPANYHDLVEGLALHRLENPVTLPDNMDPITPATEVAVTITQQLIASADVCTTVDVSAFNSDTFEAPEMATLKKMYTDNIQAGHLSPLILLFNKELIERQENVLVMLLGLGETPDVDFVAITIDLPTLREALSIDETIASGHDMVTFPITLDLRALQIDHELKLTSSANGVYTRLFLLNRNNATDTPENTEPAE